MPYQYQIKSKRLPVKFKEMVLKVYFLFIQPHQEEDQITKFQSMPHQQKIFQILFLKLHTFLLKLKIPKIITDELAYHFNIYK